MAKITPNLVMLVASIILLIVAINLVITSLHDISNYKTISQDKKRLNSVIENSVNGCWLAKIAKNLSSCKEHLIDIQNQCKTNANYSGVPACNDPRIEQMVNEQMANHGQ